jgi:hypothetical protein
MADRVLRDLEQARESSLPLVFPAATRVGYSPPIDCHRLRA